MSTESLKWAKFDREDGSSFDTPEAVLRDSSLSREAKKGIFLEWKRRVAATTSDQTGEHHETLDAAIAKLAGLQT